MPIAHLIPRMPFATTIGDSLLEGAGGFSTTLGFWWHIHFPDEVVQRTLQFKTNNNDSMLMLINILEFVMVIINYCTALHVVWTSPVTDDPHPVILNITDNSSPLSWTLHTCKQSKIGQMLACLFCSLLINLPLGINSQWISTIDNKIADNISCLKKQSDKNSSPAFDYTILKQTYLELRPHLADMGHCIDQELAQSQRGPDLETEAAWKAHYIKWADIFGIPDCCGYYKSFIRIVAIYIKNIQCVVSYNNKQVLHSATVQGYAKAANNLFKLRSFSPPDNFSDPNNMTAILLKNMLQEEDIARQCAPLENEIFAKMHQMATASKCKDSVNDLLFDVVALGHYIGPRLSKYAQTTKDKVNNHTYPSGKMVIKAFIANEFIFYNEKKRIVKDLNKDSLQQARFVKITWHVQKNHQNGQLGCIFL